MAGLGLAAGLAVAACSPNATPSATRSATPAAPPLAATPTWPTPAQTSTTATQPAVTRATIGRLSFDYPAAWTLTLVGHPKHYESVLAFLASPGATASETCGPDFVPGLGGGCTDAYELPAGTIVVRVSRWDGPPAVGGMEGRISGLVAQGAERATVAGQPAAYLADYRDADTPSGGRTGEWLIAAPGGQDWVGYSFVVTVGGAGGDPKAASAAIVSSIRFGDDTTQP